MASDIFRFPFFVGHQWIFMPLKFWTIILANWFIILASTMCYSWLNTVKVANKEGSSLLTIFVSRL